MSNKKDIDDLDEEAVKFVGMVFGGGVHAVPSVKKQPEVKLGRWQVARLNDGDRLIGFHIEWREGRVSTPVTQFDPSTRQCVTQSGRRYELVGPPGFDPDGRHVYNSAYSGVSATDVTNEYWSAIQAPAGEKS